MVFDALENLKNAPGRDERPEPDGRGAMVDFGSRQIPVRYEVIFPKPKRPFEKLDPAAHSKTSRTREQNPNESARAVQSFVPRETCTPRLPSALNARRRAGRIAGLIGISTDGIENASNCKSKQWRP
jgi:hypothetical protein